MLIATEQQLRSFLPNALATVEGEASLYEKLSPYLREAEAWLQEAITGKECLKLIAEKGSSLAHGHACRAVTCDALMHGIPSLDLVLTPNGFGIVSNQNIAPASRERITRLIDSMEQQRDDAVTHLLHQLHPNETWQHSEAFGYWSQTLFPNISVTSQLGIREHQFSQYLSLVPRIVQIESGLANAFISPELLRHLHLYQFGIGYKKLSPAEQSARAYVITRLRPQILAQVQGQPLQRHYMEDLVQYIRSQPDMFPQWYESETAKLFAPPLFENKKDAQGYFF